MIASKAVDYTTVVLGCDPEFFFSQNGVVVGSESVIEHDTDQYIVDGVQAELNPSPNACREILARNIRDCLESVARIKGNGTKIEAATTVEVTQEEFDKLSDKSKKFGCGASHNSYTKAESVITVDPSVYTKRSAGGHIHLGLSRTFTVGHKPEDIVPVLDVILGNTCVLLDRDPGNVERRKSYGRAGEYRLPSHGLEYRTLSNFWLRHYTLFSLVFGLARHAVRIVDSDMAEELLGLINMDDIQQAINENDFNLARKNFDLVSEWIATSVQEDNRGSYPITGDTLDNFYKFVDDGIEQFGDDILENWTPRIKGQGAYTFLLEYEPVRSHD